MTKTITSLIVALFLIVSTSCGDAGTRVGNPPTVPTTSNIYPSNLAIASPLKTVSSGSSSLSSYLVNPQVLFLDEFNSVISQINSILSDSATSCNFSISEVTQVSSDATCYGPSINYQNHPDNPTQSGQLPPGDVGIWQASQDGQACSSAQLNAKSNGISSKSNTALLAFAAMLCTINNDSSLSLPATDGASIDIKTELSAYLDATDASSYDITTASLTLNITSDTSNVVAIDLPSSVTELNEVIYSLVFTSKTDSTDTINFSMTHYPINSDGNSYLGRINIQNQFTDNIEGNCMSGDLKRGTSVTYYKRTTSQINMQAKSATFCSTSANPFTSSGDINAALTFNSGANTNGWGSNFQILTGQFDPGSLTGDYNYIWQAGYRDSHSRTLNVERTDSLNATSYFGFGNSVTESTSGVIEGLICNWAGPSNSHVPADFVQRQIMSRASVEDEFVADTSQITYAPTNSCSYDGTGTFTYDSNGDGSVNTDASTTVTADLYSTDDLSFTEPPEPSAYNTLGEPTL